MTAWPWTPAAEAQACFDLCAVPRFHARRDANKGLNTWKQGSLDEWATAAPWGASGAEAEAGGLPHRDGTSGAREAPPGTQDGAEAGRWGGTLHPGSLAVGGVSWIPRMRKCRILRHAVPRTAAPGQAMRPWPASDATQVSTSPISGTGIPGREMAASQRLKCSRLLIQSRSTFFQKAPPSARNRQPACATLPSSQERSSLHLCPLDQSLR